MNKQPRRHEAYLCTISFTQLNKRNPYVVAWWSAAFPGFGHMLLGKYIRGFLLFVWEVVINVNASINEAMVYSFSGRFDLAKDVLDAQWMTLYIPVYLFSIWDSYRSTVDLNKLYTLANRENAELPVLKMGPLEINYLDKRRPLMAAIWSAFMPGTGQLYIHRLIPAFFSLTWWIVFCYFSHLPAAAQWLFLGSFEKASAVLNPEWFLFMPSVYGFAIYDAYVQTVAGNTLFENEQKHFLKNTYQPSDFKLQ